MSKIRPSTQIMASGTPSASTFLRGDNSWATVTGSSVVDWVSVTAHGAVGDDTTDDTAAIQAAINATPVGGTCYFPVPSVAYKITAQLTVPRSMRLFGAGTFIGQHVKIHQATANTNGISNTATGATWVIEGLEIAGSGGTSGSGVYSEQAVFVHRCYIHAFYDNLYIYSTNTIGSAFYCTVVESFFDSAVRAGLVLAGIINNFTWRDCRAVSNATGVLVGGGPLGFRMYGGSVEVNSSIGIDIDGLDATTGFHTQAVLISGTYFEGNGAGTTDVRIGNTNTVYGVRIESCPFIVGSAGNPAWHINAPNVGDLTIDDCTFWGTAAVNVSSTATGVVWGPNYNKNSGTVTLPATVIRLDSANVTPSADGTAAVGTSPYLARADHVHPGGGGGGVTVQDEGTALTARSIIDFVGTGVTATDDAANSRTVVTIPGASGSSGLLAAKQYRPTTQVIYSTSSATPADLDATNLVVTFTAPSSGQVLVRLNGMALFPVSGTPTADDYQWCLRNGTTMVTGSDNVVVRTGATQQDCRYSVEFLISGLTSGSSYTWKWAHKLSANDTVTGRMLLGDNGSGSVWGSATMSVWSA